MLSKGKAILFVHGILGTPDFFEFFKPAVPSGFRVVSLILEGHDGSVRDFGNASMRKWKQQVSDAVAELNPLETDIIIAAHSMGTLFAISEALDGNIAGIFLLNPPLVISPTWNLIKMPIRVLYGKNDSEYIRAAKNSCGITLEKNPLRYLCWIPRYMELFREIKEVKKKVCNLNIPLCCFLSGNDEMVSPSSARYFRNISGSQVFMLPNSFHYWYQVQERDLIISEFSKFTNHIS